jgi:hypothetical protein
MVGYTLGLELKQLKGNTQTKAKCGLASLMVGIGIACSNSVICNLAILGNFADMSQLSV